MRDSTNLQRGDGRFVHHVDAQRGVRSDPVSFDLSSAVAEFLKDAVAEHLTRQRVDHRGGRDETPPAPPVAALREPVVNVPTLSEAAGEMLAGTAGRIPTWK